MRLAWILAGLWACGSTQTAIEPEAATAAQQADEQVDPQWTHFGQPFTVASAVAAAQVLADPSAFAEAPVRMQGELTQVCQKAGCWAVVRDEEGRSMRVTMKDHAFGIAKDSIGNACDVEGQLVRKDVDPERLEHYASEGAGDHPEAGKAEAWELVATAVATKG